MWLVALAIALAASLASPLLARQGRPADAQQAVPAAGPLTLTLRFADNPPRFRPGEVIPIELHFNAGAPLSVDLATGDRSGRLTIDTFQIEPHHGVSDPLLDYLAAATGVIGGGLTSDGTLGQQPVVVRLSLNDWLRFDEPGSFRLSVRSARVSTEPFRRGTVIPVESNTASFEIVPRDAAWEASRLEALTGRMTTPRDFLDRRTACRELSYLGTDGAVDVMIRRFTDRECGFSFMAGLYGAPNRSRVVREMTARLTAPDQDMNESYLRTLATLSVLVEHQELRAPQNPDVWGRRPGSSGISQRRDLIEAALTKYRAMVKR